MQSFLQYRNFGKHVELQYERDREKAAGAGANDIGRYLGDDRRLSSFVTNSSMTSSISSIRSIDSTDLEKERNSAANSDTTDFVQPLNANPGDVEQQPRTGQSDLRIDPVSDSRRTSGRSRQGLRLSTATTTDLERTGTTMGVALTGVQIRTRTTNEGKGQPGYSQKVFVVGFEGEDDPLDPRNWSTLKRVFCTLMIAFIAFAVGIASSIDSSILDKASADFGVSKVVESMATGLYLVGFGAGSLFAGPFSETLGRNPIYIVSLVLYMIFIMASGLAPNIGAQLAFRFLAGFFGSPPLTCVGGSISDLWNPMERVFAFSIFANAAFSGPVLGPVIGGFIAGSDAISWRWTEWVTLMLSGLILGLVLLFQPETYSPTLLKWKSEHLRRVTGDKRYRAEVEILDETLLTRLKRACYRPIVLTLREPIIMLIAVYLTVLYIILFTFFDGYDYIFAQIHGTSPGITGLCFLGLEVGLFLPGLLVPVLWRWAARDLARVKEQGGTRLPPEFRLWFAMLGGSITLPVSLFWMGWTSDSDISIWSPIIASVLFGYGTVCVFISCYQYVIDSYEQYSASALACITLIRYAASGGMTVAGIPFYENMGVHWTLTILGALAALMAPVPYVFYKYGKVLRKHSKYAVTAI